MDRYQTNITAKPQLSEKAEPKRKLSGQTVKEKTTPEAKENSEMEFFRRITDRIVEPKYHHIPSIITALASLFSVKNKGKSILFVLLRGEHWKEKQEKPYTQK